MGKGGKEVKVEGKLECDFDFTFGGSKFDDM